MSRRTFLQSLTVLFSGFALPAITQAKPERMQWKTLQTSPVAGFQYHQGEILWPQLATGQPVMLVRESGNRFDQHSAHIQWQSHKLGYTPPDEQCCHLATD